MSASPVFICLVLVEEYGQQQQTTTLMASSPGHGHGHQPASSGIHGGSPPPSLSSGVSSASQDSAICASSSSGAASPLPPPDPGQAPASSCSTFSTAAFSAASAGHGPTLHLAWMPVDPLLPNPKTEGPQLVLRLNVHNVLEQMRELAHQVAEQYPARPGWLVCSRRAVRQSLYPLCAQALLAKLAAEKGEDQQIFSARLPLPALFHRFLPFPMTTNASPANDQRQQQKHQPKNGSPMAEAQQQQQHESSAVVEETLASELQKLVADLLDSPVVQAAKNADDLEFLQPEKWLEPVQQGYRPALCTDVHSLNARVVVRARGLPWQVSDLDVALFFAGLDIARGGIALCLGPEGRRNGECLVRFERPEHRDWALERHRRHLRQRYIEVYRAGADEFVRHAVGTDLCALEFAKRADQPAAAPTATATAATTTSSAIEEQQQQQAEPGQAMIVRMRGLPFAATEQEIRDFFASDGLPCGIQELGVLFVHRPDGRPSGDAFVLFADEASGRRALQKHRQRMGIRYIELFRTTQAEVQQLFNARQQAMQLTISSQQQQQQQQNAAVAAMAQQQQQQQKTNGVVALQQQQQGLPMLPFGGQQQQQQQNGTGGGNGGGQQPQQQQQPNIRQRDCLRLRGLPYEAQVQQVVEFMGPHARHVLFQGVHMIYNAAGHPSGEAFIQMESEPAAALAAQECHNKFMELGKKRRYIEVFQCCAEDMSLLLNVMPAAAGAGGNSQPPQATPNGGGGLLAAPPPPLLPLPVAFTQAGGGVVPAPSPLLTFSPAVGPFLTAFGGAAGGDPGAMLMHQFATAPQLAQLYAPEAAIGPGGDFCWLPAGLRNGAAAAFPAGLRGAVAAAAAGLPPPVGSFAPTPLLPIHHHTQHQQQHLLHNHSLINHHNGNNHYQPFVNHHHLHMQHHHFGPGPAEMAAATAVKLG